MNQTVTEQISPNDWNAMPSAVQRILLSFQNEMDAMRRQIELLEQRKDVTTPAHHQKLERYHTLVEQQFLHGLTTEQQEEIERLGKEIDEVNVSSYPSLSALAETIAAQTGTQPE